MCSPRQLEGNLRSTEGDLRSALEKQEDVAEERRGLQHKLDTLTARLSEETAARRLTQDKLDTLKAQISDAKRSKVSGHTLKKMNTLLIPFGKFWPPYLSKATAVARAALPPVLQVHAGCFRVSIIHQTLNDMDYRIFNVRT